MAGFDPVITAMARVAEKAIENLSVRSRPSVRVVRATKRYRAILVQTIAEIEGEGSNPRLLLDIYGGGE
ncbi:hypothetical protein [Paracoccus sp. (in: a-proteobacteria)]|uniref:hypothetical protein n=1 Tax=Paracoccus sp. TaxID=267 RepID=UPI00396C3106